MALCTFRYQGLRGLFSFHMARMASGVVAERTEPEFPGSHRVFALGASALAEHRRRTGSERGLGDRHTRPRGIKLN